MKRKDAERAGFDDDGSREAPTPGLRRLIVPRDEAPGILLFGAALAELAGPLSVKRAIDGPLHVIASGWRRV